MSGRRIAIRGSLRKADRGLDPTIAAPAARRQQHWGDYQDRLVRGLKWHVRPMRWVMYVFLRFGTLFVGTVRGIAQLSQTAKFAVHGVDERFS